MTVDVVLLTKNSMNPCLKECVESIYKNVPVNHLIVVDGWSTDGTIRLLESYPDIQLMISCHGNRAVARDLGYHLVETDWFVSVDSDVVLGDGWFNDIWQHVADDVGAIEGFNTTVFDKDYNDYVSVVGKKRQHWIPLLTGGALIRTSTVKDSTIPKHLIFWDDQYIKTHIEKQNYKWLFVDSPEAIHFKTTSSLIKDAYSSGYMNYKVHSKTVGEAVFALITILPKLLYTFMKTRNPKVFKPNLKLQWHYSFGVLKAWSRS